VELPMLSLLQQQGVHLVSFGGVSMDPTQDDKNTLMNKLGMSFRRWCRQKHIEKPPATWNMRLIGRADSNTVYPALDTNVKAAHTKPILFFLADVAKEISDHCSCNGCELRALTLWGACRFLWATDRPSLFLEPELKACALESGMVALTSYADLSGRNLQRSGYPYPLV
ncbi:unnamed protein product, partial [Effrenium voratum]